MIRLLPFAILILCQYASIAQKIDSILLSKIEDNFAYSKSVNIEFGHFSHQQFEETTNLKNLHTIIELLKKHEHLKIELRSHSDCRGKERFNLALTKRQADQIKNWLVYKGGFNQDRILSSGKGELFPIAECPNCNCSENIYRINRRLEIVKIE